MSRRRLLSCAALALAAYAVPSVTTAQIDSVTFANVASRHELGDPANDVRSFVASSNYILGGIQWGGFAVPQDDGSGGFPTWGAELSVRVTHVPSGNTDELTLGSGREFDPGRSFSGSSRILAATPVTAGDAFELEFFEETDDADPDPDAIWNNITIDFLTLDPGNGWVEQGGDAPAWPASQGTTGLGDIDSIFGGINQTAGDYVDSYRITVTDPANFTATADALSNSNSGATFPGRLWLFDAQGNLVMANDLDPFLHGEQPYLSDPSTFPGELGDDPGSVVAGETYVLAISSFANDPEDADGNDLATLFDGLESLWGPNPEAGPFNAWENENASAFFSGSYLIGLTGAQFAVQVPEPASLGMLLCCAAPLLLRWRNRRRRASFP